MREEVSFPSSGVSCGAWLYRAEGQGPRPIVIMAHGLGATRELGLDAYAQRFRSAGLSVLAFDYRHYGSSEGQPRELLSIGKQLDDWRAAIAFAKTLPDVDRTKIAIWGSSFGGGHVLQIASEDHGLAAGISQVPFSDGLASSLRISPLTSLRITLAAIVDLVRNLFRMSPHYIRLLGKPGEVALMSAPDCVDGYGRLIPPQLVQAGLWQNRVSARTGLAVSFYSPGRRANRIQIPILIAVAEQDSIAPAGPTIRAAARAPRSELKRYPGGHFDYYVGSGFDVIIADELEFLRRHLGLT